MLKLAKGPAGMTALWEFYIGAALQSRSAVTSGQAHCEVIVPSEIHVLRGCACLLSRRSHQRYSLENILKMQVGRGKAMPEPLAMFYCTEMARCVAALHKANVLHCQLSPSAFLVRDTADASLQWEEWTERREGAWQYKGLAVGGFSQAVDLALYPSGTSFQTPCPGPKAAFPNQAQCSELLEGLRWREQVDTVGIAGVLHQLLFNCPLPKLAADTRRLRTPCPQGYDEELWGEAFTLLLSVGRGGDCEGSVAALGKLQHLVEAAIVGRKNWGKELKVMLCQQSYALCDTTAV